MMILVIERVATSQMEWVWQYIGEIGKTDNGIVVVTTHLYDGRKAPLDISYISTLIL